MGLDAGGLRDVLEGGLKDVAGRVVHKLAGDDAVPHELTAEPAFKSDLPWAQAPDAECLVLVCGDCHYLPHIDRFILEGLKLANYYIVAVPGGVQWLALPDILPKHNKVARGLVEFLVKRHNVKRIVCIAHEDCGAYNDSQVMGAIAHLATGKTVAEHQIDQLRTAGRFLTDTFGVIVELYYASVAGSEVQFHKVE